MCSRETADSEDSWDAERRQNRISRPGRNREEFEDHAQRLQEVRDFEDLLILRNASVIGLTTTGAAKYRRLIQNIKPRITIVEEAAEVLESHIVTSLTSGCQHLILIGDHQQLRPKPTVYDLAKNYDLDMSLFERMVKIGMRMERLNAQHRMRPEIAQLMGHIYDDLQNHESVMHFDPVKGVDKNIFFIDHNKLEEYVAEGQSRSNIHEAKYLAALCRYFILQGYKPEQITILTMYTGQLLKLKNEMPRDVFEGVRVCAVDSFQGEENDIILLSLVRSNEEGNIGFLKIHNRVCVALSRAKKGFYCIGNMGLMSAREVLWKNIIADMRANGQVGRHLTLMCRNHPQNIIHASRSTDFRKAPAGGCMEPCVARLDCGHVCKSYCHPADPEHKKYKCPEKCTKMLCEIHKCLKLCWETCGRCDVLVTKEIPDCKHEQKVPCFMDPKTFMCQASCQRLLACELHHCTRKCSDKCTENCTTKVQKTLKCGHENTVECYMDIDKVTCKVPCRELLKCGHLCQGTCGECFQGRLHVPCKAKCDRSLFCGHLCREACTRNCPPCSQPCENKCFHSKCMNKCGERCVPCVMKCKWQCKHYKCSKPCSETCDRPRCNKGCKKKLRCGHRCIGMCGEPCPKKCRICDKDEVNKIVFGGEDKPYARFVELQPCGHVIEKNAMDHYMDDVSNDSSIIQLKGCPRCKTPIRNALRYGNVIKKTLADLEKVKAELNVAREYNLQRSFQSLQDKLRSRKIHQKFRQDLDNIIKSVSMTAMTAEKLNLHENQINFLSFLSSIMSGMESVNSKLRLVKHRHLLRRIMRRKDLFKDVAREIEVLKEALITRIIIMPRQTFSEQEKEEINDGLLRLSLIVSYHTFARLREERPDPPMVGATLGRIANAVKSPQGISKDEIDLYTKQIEELFKKYGLDEFHQHITDEEKNIKSMGMSEVHWFKCSKGHIYCIDDCRGAMEEGQCPECGSSISGTNHELQDGNILTGEVDGARHADRRGGWSEAC